MADDPKITPASLFFLTDQILDSLDRALECDDLDKAKAHISNAIERMTMLNQLTKALVEQSQYQN